MERITRLPGFFYFQLSNLQRFFLSILKKRSGFYYLTIGFSYYLLISGWYPKFSSPNFFLSWEVFCLDYLEHLYLAEYSSFEFCFLFFFYWLRDFFFKFYVRFSFSVFYWIKEVFHLSFWLSNFNICQRLYPRQKVIEIS